MKKESKKLMAMIMSLVLGLAAANFTYAADTAVQEAVNEDSHNESVTNEAVEVKAIGLKSAYATGESINIKVRVINKGSESLRIGVAHFQFGKADTMYVKLTGADGNILEDNYYGEIVVPSGYDSYLNVNEYIEREYLYDMGEVTPGAYTLEITFRYEDDNEKTQRVSKKYPVVIGQSDGTEYEEDEITGGAVFLSDKAGEIKEYTDELSRYPLKYFPVKIYEYPGANYYSAARDGWHYTSYEMRGLGLEDFIPTKVYTDENGKVWGYLNSNKLPNGAAWYCMSSPRDNLTNYLRGDVTIDQKVDLDDATMLLKMAVGIEIFFATTDSDQWVNADVNEDGKVDLKDAKTVLKMAVGVSEDF